jgi:hypothetical protein
VGSSSDEIEFFNLHNPSSHTMALKSIQSLTEISTRNLHRGKGRPARKADNLTAIFEPTMDPRRLTRIRSYDVEIQFSQRKFPEPRGPYESCNLWHKRKCPIVLPVRTGTCVYHLELYKSDFRAVKEQ